MRHDRWSPFGVLRGLKRPKAGRRVREPSLTTRIALASGLVALVFVIGVYPFANALRDARRADRANQRVERAKTAAVHVIGLIVDVETAARGFILTGEPRFLEPRDRARRALPRELTNLARLTADDAGAALRARSIATTTRSYFEQYSDPLIVIARRDRRQAASRVRAGEGRRRTARLRAQVAELIKAVEPTIERRRAEQAASERRAEVIGVGGLITALLVLLWLALYLRRSIAWPAGRLAEGAHSLAAGDLSTRVEVNGTREFSELAQAFNDMAASLQSSRGKLESVNEELVAASREARAANSAKSEFLSRMSHELRTPLNSIIGFSQLLEMDDLDSTQREYVERVLSGGRHLLSLINEVLDLARIESGALGISVEPVDASAAVEDALELVRPLALRRSIELVAAHGGGPVYVLADQQRLRQVLLNLLSNAVKYNQIGGSVRLTLDRRGERLSIGVHDTGPGLTRGDIEKAFVPFERLDVLNGDIEGTGLGLPLSKLMLEAMGGRLSVESEPGAGSVFRVELPLDPNPPGGRETTEAVLEADGPVDPDQAASILYIEDNASNIRLVEHMLARRPAVRLLTAVQGRRGLELAEQHCPDVVLLDLHLPDMHGSEVLRRLRANERTQHIPVIVVSADATGRQVERLLESGAQGYLTKPLDVPEFLRTVDAVTLNRHGTHDGQAPRSGVRALHPQRARQDRPRRSAAPCELPCQQVVSTRHRSL